ncbi:hypothetical protein PG991_006399 [Apiospora marii]|uniref:Heterokaryon incompatibility domain-containing protein n=2 Tax=Apiospora marii TaxID=335849 RepID=A0ABR1SC35_9PEZI
MASRSDEDGKLNYYEWRMVRRGERKLRVWGHIRYIAEALHTAAAFNSLFGRPWFTRTWVVQELALSPRTMVICGKHVIDWDIISRAHGRSKTNFEVPNHLGTILRFRDWPGDFPDDLMSHMLMAWHKESLYARDKIYGLLGLQTTHGQELSVDVDYESSDSEIFTQFTKAYLEKTGNLQFLAICRGCKVVPAAAEIVPSWVIDPAYDKNREPLPDQLIGWSFDGWNRYPQGLHAGGGSSICTPVFNGNLLGLQALQLDVVTGVSLVNTPASARVGDSYAKGIVNSIESAVTFGRFYLDARSRCLAPYGGAGTTYTHTRQTRLDAFWQVIRGKDPTYEKERATRECADIDGVLVSLAGLVKMGRFVVVPVLAVAYAYMLVMSGILGFTSYIEFFGRIGITKQRRLITTKKGYIGLAPRETRVGDVILVLQGYCAPIVARRGQRWRVVGDAYIHGVMEGEAFDETKCTRVWFE